MLKNDARSCMVGEADEVVDLSDDKSIDAEKEVKVIGKSSRSLSFHERMKDLSPYHRSLNDWMKDEMVCYVDLLRPGLHPSREDNEMKPRASRRLANQK